MDEVLAVGDSNFQSKCLTEFNRYKEMGKTVILVTHDIATVQRYCDRAMLVRDGKIMKIGSANDVGGEYIYQNMSDEEKRIFDEQKNSTVLNKTEKSTQKSQKVAEITEVKFLDKNGKEKNVFESGEDIIVNMKYIARKVIKRPVFGVAVYTQDGIPLTGPNTRTSKFEIAEINGEGSVDFCIKKTPFFPGKYYFTVGIYDWSCLIPFDVQPKEYSFQIFSNEEKQYGLISINHIWSIK